MKRIYVLILFINLGFIFSQEKTINMQRVESLFSIESYNNYGKIVNINSNGDILAVNSNSSDVYLLKNGTSTWINIGGESIVTGIYCSSHNSILIESSTGLSFSDDTINYSLTQILFDTQIFSSGINSNGTIFSGTTDGLYRSNNNGESWSITYTYPLKMAINTSNEMFIEEYNNGLCRSTDLGMTWEDINYNLSKELEINDIEVAMDGTVFISVKDSGIYKLASNTWVEQGGNSDNILSLHAGKDGLMYCSFNDKIYRKAVSDNNWTEVKSSMGNITTFASNSNKIIAGYTNDLIIFESIDSGITWSMNGVDKTYPTILSLLTINDYVFVGTNNGIYTSTNSGATWESKQLDCEIRSIELGYQNNIYLATDDGLYRSLDYGSSWVKRPCPIYVNEIVYNDSVYYICGNSLYKSDKLDDTVWNYITPPSNSLLDLSISNNRLYLAAYYSGGIFYTETESGWTNCGLGSYGSCIEANINGDLYARTEYGLYLLRSGSSDWSYVLSDSNISDIYTSSDQMVFATASGLFYYTIDGYEWYNASGQLPASQINAISKDVNGYIYAGMNENEGLYKSTEPLLTK